MGVSLLLPLQQKCAQYWPQVDPLQFGDLVVEAREVSILPTYTLRQFTLSNVSEVNSIVVCIVLMWIALQVSTGVKRQVDQYHFTYWPDFGVPAMAYDMLHFIKVVRSEMREEHGPLVIHCRWVGPVCKWVCPFSEVLALFLVVLGLVARGPTLPSTWCSST